MAATKRNPGLTSAVPRASLNDEELVSIYSFVFFYLCLSSLLLNCFYSKFFYLKCFLLVFRKCMCTKKHYKRSSIPFHVQRRTIFNHGRQHILPTATNAKVCCGVSHVKACVALSVMSNVTKNVETYSMPIVYKVSLI